MSKRYEFKAMAGPEAGRRFLVYADTRRAAYKHACRAFPASRLSRGRRVRLPVDERLDPIVDLRRAPGS